jgi:hypothetical protein
MLLEYFHLLASLVGIICLYEARLLLKVNELWLLDKRLIWSTSIELIWFVICLIGLFIWDLTPWKMLVCLLFIVNYLFSCVYTWYLLRKTDFTDPSAIVGFRIPRWFLEYHFSFGFIYALINLILFL